MDDMIIMEAKRFETTIHETSLVVSTISNKDLELTVKKAKNILDASFLRKCSETGLEWFHKGTSINAAFNKKIDDYELIKELEVKFLRAIDKK